MKILQLRFKNLNSLVGEWTIDFTAPEYISDGIFAISGPTGAGKSTIMDAICLALYGRTPRLKGISKNSNEIMSRHTGECFAEVVFETQKGQFRCTWRQHRARRKANEELQNPAHEIAEAQSGIIIESKIKTVAKAIEDKTGMDFDRFTQSMLLAQGGFAAFLQADPNERAPILEQITGTEIYSQISINVYERRRAENSKLDLFKAETAGIIILKDEEEALITQQLSDNQKTETDHTKKKTAIDTSIEWLKVIDKIKEELSEIVKEAEFHSITLLNFEPQRQTLQRSLKAAGLDGEYATLNANRKLQSDELASLLASEIKVPDLVTSLELANKKHLETSSALDQVKHQVNCELAVIKTIRSLDVTIKEKRLALNKGITDHQEILLRKIGQIREKKTVQDELMKSKSALEEVEIYLNSNAADAILVTELTGIIEKLRNLKEAGTNYSSVKALLIAAEKGFKISEQQYETQAGICQMLERKHIDAQEKVARTKQALDQLLGERQLREYRTDLTHLMIEMAYLRKIALLENERKLLEDDRPCPLCGALHHPYADGNIPQPDETQRRINEVTNLIEKADQFEAALKGVEADEKKVAAELIAADKQLQQAQYNKEANQLVITNKLAEQTRSFEIYTDLQNEVAAKLLPWGFTQSAESDPDMISQILDKRIKNWQARQQQKSNIEVRINGSISRIEGLNLLIKTLSGSLKEKLTEIVACRSELNDLTDQRIELYGSKNPDTEELQLNLLNKNAEKSEREVSDQKNKLAQELQGLNNRIKELITSTSCRKGELDTEEKSFRLTLQAAGFEDESDFISCRLSKEKREEMGRQAASLDQKQADLALRKKDREERLLKETSRKLTEMPIGALLEEQQATFNALVSIREEIGAKRQRLADNLSAKLRFGEITRRIEAQKSECKRWELLYNLIGSADGKKYRNFAQGLTFEIMVAHANLQLMKLTDRYLLIRDKEQPLDLNVIDNYQAGEVRSTKNLSGGESFIVSLALALGLSKMASKKVRVDSLFLDEGFGSLDEDILETALETLASLRQDGKLIGVISHVAALKDRIPAKILVQKVSGGKSVISGPGCSRN